MQIEGCKGITGMLVRRALAAALGTAALAAGCTSPGPLAELPFGEWAGEGSFVYEAWPKAPGGEEGTAALSIHRRYPTTLTIRPGRIDDRDVVELEIISERGRLGEEDKDTRTHLKLALVKAKQVSDSTILYRVVGLLFNPGPEAELKYDDQAPPFTASCTIHEDARVFQIPYMEGFFDTIRFRGDHVDKTGLYYEKNAGLVHWWEHLTRQR
ncbi:MAG: hypothetical protein ACYSUQ_00825 [Planctomycetota bacterium]|jgi:hypothetical protein